MVIGDGRRPFSVPPWRANSILDAIEHPVRRQAQDALCGALEHLHQLRRELSRDPVAALPGHLPAGHGSEALCFCLGLTS